MSGPWERYATPQDEEGPWNRFAVPDRKEEPRPEDPTRIAAQGLRGVNQALYGAPAALLDVAALPFEGSAWLTNKLGLSEGPSPIAQTLRGSAEEIRKLPDRLANDVGQAFGRAPTSFEPQTRGEKIAGKVGEGVGGVISTLVPATMAARYAGTPFARGIGETLATQPAGQLAAGAIGGAVEGATDSPLAGTLASFATPLAAAAARGVISPVTQRLTDQERSLIAAAQREGIPLTPAQVTGNQTLQGLEAAMARMPLANGPMQDTLGQQRQAFNRAVMQRTGQAADNVAPATLDDAFQRLGGEFDRLAGQTQVRFDRQFVRAIDRVEQDYGRRLPTDVRPVFESYMRDIDPIRTVLAQSGAVPRIDGQVYANIRSDLTKRIRESDNTSLRTALGGIVRSFDDALERSAPDAVQRGWQTARQQYQALMTVDRAARGGTQATRGKADVPYGAFNAAVRQADPSGYARGRGQYNELARVGDYLAGKVPNSGTPERAMYSNILTGGALFGGGAALGSIPAAAAMAATPWTLSRLYNSRIGQRYLANQMADRTNLRGQWGAQAAQGLLGP